MIRIDDLHCRLAGRTVLHAIETAIPRTGLTAVIGPNGAGKSSLLHCLAGLTAPCRGSVRVDGVDITAARPAQRAHLVALLTQSSPALPRLSVRDLVAFGRWPHHRGRPGPADHNIIAQSLAAFDLTALADRQIENLSGGQRQRAFVAMAHAQSTPWMLLDEPLAALDPKYARDIMQRLHLLSRPGAEGRGIVVVLHDLGMAARYADWIISLKEGKLVNSAPRDQVMTSARLTALFDSDILVEKLHGRWVVAPA